jgi:simple sugar transport system substrate-binding protein
MKSETGTTSRRAALKYLGLGGGAVAASAVLSACTSVQEGQDGGGDGGSSGVFPDTPDWRFVFVNHVTTNSFFVPTITGLEDAAKLVGVPKPQWTGSENGNVAQMASAMETAINSKVDGIAIALTDDNAFVDLTKRALEAGIPVVAYNANAAGNFALTSVGQDLYLSGVKMGERIAEKVTSGDILVGISQPGGNNVQPRLDGIIDALKEKAPGVRVRSVNTGAEQANELNAITAAYTGNTGVKGIYAVDAGTTAACAKLIADKGLSGKIGGGGFDLLDDSVEGVNGGALDFTIDQSPYLQGFLSVLYLYLYRLSGTLVFPPVTDTGLTFVTKENIGPYAKEHSAFEGGDNRDLIDMPSSIPLPPPSVLTR